MKRQQPQFRLQVHVKEDERVREMIRNSSFIYLTVFALNPFRLAQLHKDVSTPLYDGLSYPCRSILIVRS